MTRVVVALLCAIAVVPRPSFAQPPASATVSSAIAPASIGAPHRCDENQYPVSALRTATEGRVLLAFKITPQGSVEDITVRQSSGNPELDAAAVACASRWQYRPAMKNGAPVESPWLAWVQWQISVTEPFRKIDAAAFRCVVATDAGRRGLYESPLHPVIRVHFSGGTVMTATLLASSGNVEFDEIARACYASLPSDVTESVTGEVDETFVVWVGSR